MSAASTSPARDFIPVPPASLHDVLESALVIDIRPHNAYALARLPNALSLSVPSTLLKRPLFSLDKLAQMLSSVQARDKFSQWPEALSIFVYDADSGVLNEGGNLVGLLRKFRKEGYPRKLFWLQGGFKAVWREAQDIVDQNQLVEEDEASVAAAPTPPAGLLRTKHLPMSAFTTATTTTSRQVTTNAASSLPTSGMSAAYNVMAFNPFFDNIRQNIELGGGRGSGEGIPLKLPRRVRRRVEELPFEWLREIGRKKGETSGDDLAKTLAMQFYKIELGEQRRLMGVMDHHSKESTNVSSSQSVFPYSITAGVEKGEKNRYRNIWPFEHARVRLQKSCPEDDDYMNASYVQPLGTNKRYIATQGPLPATFTDFWMLCWQENVHVIVMLTREVESALIKCGNYWAEGDYGPLSLKLISTTDNPEREKRRKEREMSSGFFNFPQMPNGTHKENSGEKEEYTIRRVFQLTNKMYPEAKPRIVTQLQYLDWPDLDVPKDPRGLLELMREVDEVVENARAEGDMQWGEGPGRAPVLLHCSAGVGRTGGFIAVDAVLDGLRREMRKCRQLKALKDTGLTMPVDVGGNEVHVPIAGPSNGQTPMDVDDDHGMKTGKNGRLEASPALLGESTSLSGNSIMSSSHTSTTSLTQAMKGVDPSLGSMWSSPVQNPSTVRSAPNASRGGLEMDSWRKAVSSTQSNSGCRSDVPNAPPNSSQGPQWVQDTVLASPRGMTFDYVEPRRLHDNRSPPLLSSYDEPIRRVIEDMREQRMSLCQSLRQYVFVHRAIIEGTLKIMEQER
ncbi:hypothetical protein BDY19DRAFT_1087893, partial [Irpex rosettiformis]